MGDGVSLSQDEGADRAQSRVGEVLKGKYRLDKVLGIGGMAAVYAATHLRNANRVAVKVLHAELAREPTVRERFLREGYAANSVGHPGTVRILDDDTAEDGTVFFVMDLLDGETLDARWERKGRRLPDPEVAQLIYQVLDVLAAAHAKGIIHRDIKPENLFYTRDGVVKVLDFGIARLLEGSVKATRTGGLLGTPAFMSPEQVLGKSKDIDAQSDLWSVGATAFTLVSGRFVHDAETAQELMVFTGSRPARSLGTVVSGLPPAFVRVIDRALAFNKAERWADARAMQKGLQEAYRTAASEQGPQADTGDGEARDLTKVVAPGASLDVEALLSSDVEPAEPSHQGAAPPAGPQDPPIRMSTIAGVSAPTSDSIARSTATAVPAKGRQRAVLLAVLALVAAAACAGVIAVIARSSRPSPLATAASVTSPSPSALASAEAVVLAPPATASASTAELPSVKVETLPSTPVPQELAARAAPARPVAAAPTHVRAPASPPAAAPVPPAKASCSPPFTIDPETGKKKWKVECL